MNYIEKILKDENFRKQFNARVILNLFQEFAKDNGVKEETKNDE